MAVEDPERAEEDVRELEERAELAAAKYGRRPELVIFSVARVTKAAAERHRRFADERGIGLVLGREIEEVAI